MKCLTLLHLHSVCRSNSRFMRHSGCTASSLGKELAFSDLTSTALTRIKNKLMCKNKWKSPNNWIQFELALRSQERNRFIIRRLAINITNTLPVMFFTPFTLISFLHINDKLSSSPPFPWYVVLKLQDCIFLRALSHDPDLVKPL